MRIAFVSLGRHGGTLLCAVKLADGLQRLGHSLIYVGSRQGDYRPACPVALYVNTGQTALENALCTVNPLNHLRVARFIRAADPEVVCFPLDHAWNSLIAPWLRRYRRVFILHDPERHLGESNPFYSAASDRMARRMDRVIVLSRIFQAPLSEQIRRPVDVVPHGELGAFESYAPPPQRHKLLFLGRLRAYKGIALLLESYALARLSLPNLELSIAGSGRSGIVQPPPGVILLERWLSDAEMGQLCQSHDVIIAPYLEATQSGVVALAQSLGRAVIVTRVGGLPEQIRPETTGLIAEPNAAALAAAIVRMFNQMDYVKLGRAGKELYQTDFNWDRLAGLAAESFARAVSGR